ncbi:MAG: undecaprenyldiphospho-muramoylpentapeptide beta-N-acetylglucosaminyltransferase, partial [Acidobacteria bacterium]|nr:undecaprenyldiphospho-muramoylpentapeptide beta-N-acetylglucosaminyltransferase [Acidobacteriota bacterium]
MELNDEKVGVMDDESAIRNPQSAISVIIAGGGTGGHIYPGIAIAQEFKRRHADTEILFVGTARGLETKIVPREGFELHLIEVAALKRVSLLKRIKSLLLLPKSFLAVRSLIQEVRPDVVIGVGGYASGPVVLMASLMGVPTLVAEQNALPGFTNRMLARFVKAAAVTFDEAKKYFGDKAVITGNPVRAEFFTVSPKAATEQTHLFITGGSQGARAINLAIIDALPLLVEEKDKLSITHQTGESDYDKVRAAYLELGWRVEVKPFVEKMVEEFAKADLVMTRAGATTVAELAAAGKPALMIPFPFAADDHQRKNAEAVERAGAGRMILQAEL